MRILFLSNFYPPYELGGYEQWCQEIAQGLKERGHDVHILTSHHGVQPTTNGHTTDVSRVLHLQSDINYYHPTSFFLKRASQEEDNIHTLKKIIDQFQPDVLLVWGMWNLSLNLAYEGERLMPGRVAYFISSYWPMDEDPHSIYWQLPANRTVTELVKRPFRSIALSQLQKEGYPPPLKFEHAVCCSHYVRDTLVEGGNLPSEAGVLYGGSDPEPFLRHRVKQQASQDEPLRLLYFGRLIHDKGVHTAIEALGLLEARGQLNKVALTILGSGHPEYEAKLHNMVDQLGIGKQVHFAGRVSREEIPAWLGRFEVYLFTSIWPEPMARSVMEAMAAGLMVIGSEVGGQIEMLDHEQNALTFQAEDATGLADQITRIIDEPSLIPQLAQAGQQMALEKFTLKRMTDDIETFLSQVVQANQN